MDAINGKPPSFPEAGFELPAWYADVSFVGGNGLISPGATSEVMANLEPGTYVVECYVKTRDGVFHSAHADAQMIRGLTVVDEPGGVAPPAADATVTVTSGGGIQMSGQLGSGQQTIAVEFGDQAVYAHALGHDVHLVQLTSIADLGEVGGWMSWATPGALAEPAPRGVRFLGGAQDMPGGSTTFLRVNLAKGGGYAWIAEVPAPADKDMLLEFSVQ